MRDRTIFPCYVFRLVLSLVLLVSFCCLAQNVTANSGPELRCPDRVFEGVAFFAEIVWPLPMHSVRVRWLHKTIRPLPELVDAQWKAEVLLGLGMKERLKGSSFPLEICVTSPSGKQHVLRRTIRRLTKKYPEQWLEVERKYTALSKKDLARHRKEQKILQKALAVVSPERYWVCPLLRPLPGPVTSAFGLRRFFNKVPRSPHGGMDIDAVAGDPVRACCAGKVLLSGDYFFSGKCVYLDHGQGIISMYFHLSERMVKQGEMVRTGQIIGLVGATGRVTGPHLHFGLRVLGQLVNPQPLFAGDCGVDGQQVAP